MLGACAAALAVLYFFFGEYLSIAWLQGRSLVIKGWADTHYILAVLWYLLANIALVLGCIPAIPFMALLGGYLFGPVLGTLYVTLSSTLGATASYVVFKYALYDVVHEHYSNRLEHIREKLHHYGPSYLLVLHFMAVIPYCFINMVAVMAEISWGIFFWTTIVGSAPIFAIYAVAGKQLGTIRSINEVFSWQSIGLLFILVILALVPIVAKNIRRKK